MNKLNYYQLNQIEHLWKDIVEIKGNKVFDLLNQTLIRINYSRVPKIMFIEHHSIFLKYLLEDLIGFYFEDSLPHFDQTGHVYIQVSRIEIKEDINFLLDIIDSYLSGKGDTIKSIRVYDLNRREDNHA